MSRSFQITGALLLGAAALLAGCERGVPVERPPMDSKQTGYRGTGMVQISNPRITSKVQAQQVVPEAPAPAPADGPTAKQTYQNVQVLGDLSVAEFARTMVSITSWVAPVEGCAYCHNLQNLADDSKYTKVVARKMIQMTQRVNVDWKQHHNGTGVTCYTCHRGNNIPANIWFTAAPNKRYGGIAGDDAGQNKAAEVVGFASLPYDPFTPYLSNNKAISDIRVNGSTALPTGNRHSIKQAEHTYALMMHMSGALGVNCTFCHNSDHFASWAGPVQRVNAWYGIRMVGDLNENYLKPLTGNFPAARLGPTGDVAKVNCTTCHQGVNKPLNGAKMAKDFPALLTVSQVVATVTAAPADAPAPDVNGLLGKVLFDTGKAELGAQAADIVKTAAALLVSNPGVKIALSGYADRSGNPDANLELAKQRAFAVRDALKAAGVAENRIALKKPEFVIGGAESDARRVEIVAAK
jgi:photosynthetic reaction center cytochrome c subunit